MISMKRSSLAAVVCFLFAAVSFFGFQHAGGYHLLQKIPFDAAAGGGEYFDYITFDAAARRSRPWPTARG